MNLNPMEVVMERAVALKKLGKILGKNLAYRINDKAPTREEREAAAKELPAALEERNKLREKRDERYKEILAADAEYQRLKEAHQTAKNHADELMSIKHTCKFNVGTSNGMFFLVKAEGDSWEEVIEKVAAKK